MCKKLVFLIVSIVAWLNPCAQGVTIVWVAEANLNAAGVGYDQGWIDLLEAEGYTVDLERGAWMALDAAHLARLEAADLVIVSRTTNSGNYADDATEVTQWNSVTTPLILMTGYLARSSRWLWMNSTSLTEYLAESDMTVVEADHPVFAGVSTASGQIDMIDGAVDSGENTFLTSADVGNGTLIAKRTADNSAWIAEWEAGTPFYSGSTQTPGGKRMLLAGGGGGGQAAGSMNFTPPGQRIFLNAVLYMLGRPVDVRVAVSPMPESEQTDVWRDAELSWMPGEGAVAHDVYFATSFTDVNEASRGTPMGVLAKQGQSATTFDPGRLTFDQTYYWRIDEVEQTGTVHKGQVWSFTVESYSYPVEGSEITATASSSSSATMGPEKTIDGSGLDPDDQHSTTPEDMWLSNMTGPQPAWIQYTFDKPQTLDKLMVWNSNQSLEAGIGFGAKNITVQYSSDGDTWMTLGDFVFTQAPGAASYTADTTVDFGGIPTRGVKLTIHNNWGGFLPQVGLSEVRFFAVPVYARRPMPYTGSAEVAPEVTLSWRPGREAASHDVYLSKNEQTVIEGTAPVVTTSQPSYEATVDLAQSYYWKVIEVNEAEDPSAWMGYVWHFSTAAYLAVDDFERYTNDSPDRVFQTWIDGAGFSPDEFFPNGNAGNGTGALVGYDPQLRDIMETTAVHGGAKSVVFAYDNTASVPTSEMTRTFATARDWTRSAVKSLMVCFYGDADNPTNIPLWVKLTDQGGKSAQVTFGTAAGEVLAALAEPAWVEWNIPLSGFAGVNLTQIASITIGTGPGTGAGQFFFDDIRLYPERTIAPTPAGVLVGHWKMDNNVQDSSGNGNNGTLTGGPTYDAAGRIGAALSLDGIDDYVDCGNGASLDITDTITVAAWIKPSDVANAQHNPFVGKGDRSYMLKHYVDNYLQFSIYDDTWHNANSAELTSDFNGSWHHVAGTYDGMQVKLYLEGKLIGSDLHAGAIATTTYNVNIGRNSQNTDRLYYGLIDDVRIYHGVLSSSEIAALANP